MTLHRGRDVKGQLSKETLKLGMWGGGASAVPLWGLVAIMNGSPEPTKGKRVTTQLPRQACKTLDPKPNP